MKNNWKILSTGITTLLIAAIGGYVITNRGKLFSIMSISSMELAALILLAISFTTVLGLTNKRLLEFFGVKLMIKEWFGLTVLTAMSNYFLPLRSGASVRAVYLKKKYDFSFSRFLSTMMGLYLLTFWLASLLGIMLSLLIYLVHAVLNYYLLTFFIGFNIMVSFFLFFSPQVPDSNNRVVIAIKTMIEGWYKIKHDRELMIHLVWLSLAGYAIKALHLFYAYKALGMQVQFLDVSLLSVFLIFSVFINLTPANIGIQETMISFFSAAFGMGFDQGLLAALLFRSTNMMVVFGLSPVFSFLLLKNVEDNSDIK